MLDAGKRSDALIFQESEEMNTIQLMWEDLGVTESYKVVFENVVVDLDSQIRKDFLAFEITSLRVFTEQLIVSILI